MDRRRFCLQLAATAACTACAKVIGQSAGGAAFTVPESDDYAVWSQLFDRTSKSNCKCKSSRVIGYLITQKTAVPDGIPLLPTHASMPAILRLAYLNRHPDEYYETTVPAKWQAAFVEAAAQAKLQQAQTAVLERRFTFNKRYRLLSQSDIDEYYSLSPHIAPASWRPDPRIVRKYKGFDGITFLSLPSYDRAHRLALVWSNGSGGGCGISQWNFFTRSGTAWERQQWPTMVRETCA